MSYWILKTTAVMIRTDFFSSFCSFLEPLGSKKNVEAWTWPKLLN
jgi:hypothetical protein